MVLALTLSGSVFAAPGPTLLGVQGAAGVPAAAVPAAALIAFPVAAPVVAPVPPAPPAAARPPPAGMGEWLGRAALPFFKGLVMGVPNLVIGAGKLVWTAGALAFDDPNGSRMAAFKRDVREGWAGFKSGVRQLAADPLGAIARNPEVVGRMAGEMLSFPLYGGAAVAVARGMGWGRTAVAGATAGGAEAAVARAGTVASPVGRAEVAGTRAGSLASTEATGTRASAAVASEASAGSGTAGSAEVAGANAGSLASAESAAARAGVSTTSEATVSSAGTAEATATRAVTTEAAAARTAPAAVTEITPALEQAAGRLGVDLTAMPVENGVARVAIGTTQEMRLTDLRVLGDHLRARGVRTVQIDSGAIQNARLGDRLVDPARRASIERMLGGRLRVEVLDQADLGPLGTYRILRMDLDL